MGIKLNAIEVTTRVGSVSKTFRFEFEAVELENEIHGSWLGHWLRHFLIMVRD